MKMHSKEFAELTGVSVRTLHYYDEIGLLTPAFVDEWNGYRFYDERSLERMQEILFYRELDFPLKSIMEILSSPNYEKEKALAEQKRLLTLKKERLERLIEALSGAMEGETMSMNVFDNREFEAERKKYEQEAKEKWGDTKAYKEHAEKTAGYTKENWEAVGQAMGDLMEKFAETKKSGALPSEDAAQSLVKQWQEFITEHHYTCTKEILAGLGEMYVADERFRKNIDKHGEGTAQYMAEAIRVYCK